MPNPASQDVTRQPEQKRDAEVEKLYDSCCGSCASPAPTNLGVTVQDLTMVPQGTGQGSNP